MAQLDIIRFDDTHVGQPLPAAAAAQLGGARSWAQLAERYVQNWAGYGACLARCTAEASAPTDDEIDEVNGLVYARHLDDSLHVDVRVVGRTRSGARLVDMIRVRLN